MPGMDGMALIGAVRELLHRPDLPAILVSGYADPAVRERLSHDHATQFPGQAIPIAGAAGGRSSMLAGRGSTDFVHILFLPPGYRTEA